MISREETTSVCNKSPKKKVKNFKTIPFLLNPTNI